MDAMTVASVLGDIGYTVSIVLDGDQRKLLDSIQQFSREMKNADESFFYYSGNGIQSNSINYLVPINADIKSEEDLTFKAVNVNDVVDKVTRSNSKKNIFILDICLDAGILGNEDTESRSLTMPSLSNDVESLVVFASAPAQLIADTKGVNSPFTEALLKHIVTPGEDIRMLFGKITKDVRSATENKQIVLTNSTLTDEYCLVPSDKTDIATFTAPTKEEPEPVPVIEQPVGTELLTTAVASKFQLMPGSQNLVETGTLRIEVCSEGTLYMNGDKVYVFLPGKTYAEFGNVISDTYELKMLYKDGKEEEQTYTVGGSNSSSKAYFIYKDSINIDVRAKSPCSIYLFGKEYAKIEKGNEHRSIGPFYYGLTDIEAVYSNGYVEKKQIVITEKGYYEYTGSESNTDSLWFVDFTYRDGGSAGTRFAASLFNPLLGIGSLGQGDKVGSNLTFWGEVLGGGTFAFGFYLRDTWIKRAEDDGYTEDDIDLSMPNIIMYSGLGIAGVTALFSIFRPYFFHSRASVRRANIKAAKAVAATETKEGEVEVIQAEPQPEPLSITILPNNSLQASYTLRW